MLAGVSRSDMRRRTRGPALPTPYFPRSINYAMLTAGQHTRRCRQGSSWSVREGQDLTRGRPGKASRNKRVGKSRAEKEREQARLVQHAILPESMPCGHEQFVPSFHIATEYSKVTAIVISIVIVYFAAGGGRDEGCQGVGLGCTFPEPSGHMGRRACRLIARLGRRITVGRFSDGTENSPACQPRTSRDSDRPRALTDGLYTKT
jgi:hypothetical protein